MVVQHAWPDPPQGPQVPVICMPAFRPLQPRPVEQVPLFPVPQHGCPLPPQAPQASPVVPSMQLRPLVHAVTPPASEPPPKPPPMVVQQAWPDAPQAPHMPGVPAPLFRPAQPRPVVQVPEPPDPQHT